MPKHCFKLSPEKGLGHEVNNGVLCMAFIICPFSILLRRPPSAKAYGVGRTPRVYPWGSMKIRIQHARLLFSNLNYLDVVINFTLVYNHAVDLSKNKLYDFFSQFKTLEYSKGQTILRVGDMAQGVYFLKSGYAKLNSVSQDGKELTMVIYSAGDFFPVVWTFFGTRPSIYSYEAITDTKILRAPREKFIEFINTDKEISLEVTKGIIMRFQTALRRMRYLTFGNASSKLASILLICGKDFGIEKNNEVEIQLPLTHKDIANLVGVTRETVSLELKKFDRKGIIIYNKKIIIIKDKKSLEERAIF